MIQYNEYYLARIEKISKFILKNERIKEYELSIELTTTRARECIIIGILFLSSDLKPSIFDKNNGKADISNNCYISEKSKYFIEDEMGRLEIIFQPLFTKLKYVTTGMVLGFVGTKEGDKFYCEDVILPTRIASEKVSGKALFLSNININNNFCKIKSIIDYVYKKGIKDIVIFGPFICDDLYKHLNKGNLYILPSLNGPTSNLLCQEGLHKKLLSKNSIPLDNPCQITINNAKFTFIARFIVDDMVKYIKQDLTDIETEGTDRMHIIPENIEKQSVESLNTDENAISMLELIAKSRLMAPTAPDTLALKPTNKEVLFIEDCNFIVTGGSESFKYKQLGDVGLLTIPDFDKTGFGIIFNFDDCKPTKINFNL